MRPLVKKLGIALASPLVAGALLEAGLTIAGFVHPPLDAPLIVWNQKEDEEMVNGEGVHAMDVRSLWGLRAGAAVPDGAADAERVNSAGFRGPERAREKPAGALRVVTLGDSSTFGLGVRYAQTWSARLEAELCELGFEAQVLDGGVIGYTARQGLERYRDLMRDYEPDVVIAAFGAVNEHFSNLSGSDAERIAECLGRDGRVGRLAATLRKNLRVLHLADWIVEESRGGRKALVDSWYAENQRKIEAAQEVGRVDWTGVRRVSPDEYDAALEALAADVDADGAKLVLVAMPRRPAFEESHPILAEYTRRTKEAAARLRAPLYDAHAAFRDRARWDEEGERLYLTDDAVHPSPMGHAKIAAALAEIVAGIGGVAAVAPFDSSGAGAGAGSDAAAQ
jgi:lysophospholipase L1-like esterase